MIFFPPQVTGSDDATARLWSIHGKESDCLGVLRGHSSYISSVAVDVETGVIITAAADCTVRTWDPVTCKCKFVYEGHTARVAK